MASSHQRGHSRRLTPPLGTSPALPAALRAEVVAHLERYAEPGAEGRVFVGARGNTIHRSNWALLWHRARLGAGVDPATRLHDLRHTGNHFAAQSGASTRELMSRMGHSSMRAALIYQHATEQRDQVIAATLDAMLGQSWGVDGAGEGGK